MTYTAPPNRSYLETHDGETVRIELPTGEAYDVSIERVVDQDDQGGESA